MPKCWHWNIHNYFWWDKLLQSLPGLTWGRIYSSLKHLRKQNLSSSSGGKRHLWLLWLEFVIHLLLWIPVRSQQNCFPFDHSLKKINRWTRNLLFPYRNRRESYFLPHSDGANSVLSLLLYLLVEKNKGKSWTNQRVLSNSAQKRDGKHENCHLSAIEYDPPIIGQLLINNEIIIHYYFSYIYNQMPPKKPDAEAKEKEYEAYKETD